MLAVFACQTVNAASGMAAVASDDEQILSGRVTDAENGAAVSGATVLIKDKSGKMLTGALTNENGVFQIKLPEGATQFQVRFLGYTEKTLAIQNGQKDYKISLPRTISTS